ncbi:MAG: flagellar motor switch protein FliN [Algisphaera sp.]
MADDAPNVADDDFVAQALAAAQMSVDTLTEEVTDFDGFERNHGIELLGDVDLNVTVELGRTEMLVEDVLKLSGGSVVELDKLAGDPVDVLVNGRLVARGEVLVLNDNFCIRVSEIIGDLAAEAVSAAGGVAEPEVVAT